MEHSTAREAHERMPAPHAANDLLKFFEECTDAIAVHRDGKIVYVNPAALKLFGYRLDQVLGRSPFEFVAARFHSIVARRVFKTYAGRATAPEIEERFLHASGREVPVEVVAIPLMFEGAPSTLVHVRDLSARKELERKLAAADRLASVGFIARAVVHEVDSPLAYAINNVGLLERYLDAALPDASEPRRLCARIRVGLRGVRDAIGDVQVFAEATVEEPSELDLHAVLDAVANLAAVHLRGQARLVKRYGYVPPVVGTRTRLGQVFADVILYAAQATPAKGGENEVTIATESRDANVIVRVHSTAGARDDAEDSLSIARSMAGDEGGSVEVEDQPPGMSVVITLPSARK